MENPAAHAGIRPLALKKASVPPLALRVNQTPMPRVATRKMMITAQFRPPSPGASMLPPHVKSVGDRARAGPDRHIRRMMSYVMNLRECATGHNPVVRSASAVGGADLDAQFGGGGRAFLGG